MILSLHWFSKFNQQLKNELVSTVQKFYQDIGIKTIPPVPEQFYQKGIPISQGENILNVEYRFTINQQNGILLKAYGSFDPEMKDQASNIFIDRNLEQMKITVFKTKDNEYYFGTFQSQTIFTSEIKLTSYNHKTYSYNSDYNKIIMTYKTTNGTIFNVEKYFGKYLYGHNEVAVILYEGELKYISDIYGYWDLKDSSTEKRINVYTQSVGLNPEVLTGKIIEVREISDTENEIDFITDWGEHHTIKEYIQFTGVFDTKKEVLIDGNWYHCSTLGFWDSNKRTEVYDYIDEYTPNFDNLTDKFLLAEVEVSKKLKLPNSIYNELTLETDNIVGDKLITIFKTKNLTYFAGELVRIEQEDLENVIVTYKNNNYTFNTNNLIKRFVFKDLIQDREFIANIEEGIYTSDDQNISLEINGEIKEIINIYGWWEKNSITYPNKMLVQIDLNSINFSFPEYIGGNFRRESENIFILESDFNTTHKVNINNKTIEIENVGIEVTNVIGWYHNQRGFGPNNIHHYSSLSSLSGIIPDNIINEINSNINDVIIDFYANDISVFKLNDGTWKVGKYKNSTVKAADSIQVRYNNSTYNIETGNNYREILYEDIVTKEYFTITSYFGQYTAEYNEIALYGDPNELIYIESVYGYWILQQANFEKKILILTNESIDGYPTYISAKANLSSSNQFQNIYNLDTDLDTKLVLVVENTIDGYEYRVNLNNANFVDVDIKGLNDKHNPIYGLTKDNVYDEILKISEMRTVGVPENVIQFLISGVVTILSDKYNNYYAGVISHNTILAETYEKVFIDGREYTIKTNNNSKVINFKSLLDNEFNVTEYWGDYTYGHQEVIFASVNGLNTEILEIYGSWNLMNSSVKTNKKILIEVNSNNAPNKIPANINSVQSLGNRIRYDIISDYSTTHTLTHVLVVEDPNKNIQGDEYFELEGESGTIQQVPYIDIKGVPDSKYSFNSSKIQKINTLASLDTLGISNEIKQAIDEKIEFKSERMGVTPSKVEESGRTLKDDLITVFLLENGIYIVGVKNNESNDDLVLVTEEIDNKSYTFYNSNYRKTIYYEDFNYNSFRIIVTSGDYINGAESFVEYIDNSGISKKVVNIFGYWEYTPNSSNNKEVFFELKTFNYDFKRMKGEILSVNKTSVQNEVSIYIKTLNNKYLNIKYNEGSQEGSVYIDDNIYPLDSFIGYYDNSWFRTFYEIKKQNITNITSIKHLNQFDFPQNIKNLLIQKVFIDLESSNSLNVAEVFETEKRSFLLKFKNGPITRGQKNEYIFEDLETKAEVLLVEVQQILSSSKNFDQIISIDKLETDIGDDMYMYSLTTDSNTGATIVKKYTNVELQDRTKIIEKENFYLFNKGYSTSDFFSKLIMIKEKWVGDYFIYLKSENNQIIISDDIDFHIEWKTRIQHPPLKQHIENIFKDYKKKLHSSLKIKDLVSLESIFLKQIQNINKEFTNFSTTLIDSNKVRVCPKSNFLGTSGNFNDRGFLLCCANGQLDLLNEYLAGYPTKINSVQNNEGSTCIIIATKNGQYDMVNDLIERGAFINTTDSQRRTPLIWASIKEFNDIVNLLLLQVKGEKFNVINILLKDSQANGSNTALHYACIYDNYEIVKSIALYSKEQFSDNIEKAFFISNNSGKTPLDYLIEKRKKSLLLELENLYGFNFRLLEQLIEILTTDNKYNINKVKMFVDIIENINKRIESGYSPLIAACIFKRIESIKYIIDSRVDININQTDFISDNTPLLFSTYYGWNGVNGVNGDTNIDINSYLLNNELINIHHINKHNYDALFAACQNLIVYFNDNSSTHELKQLQVIDRLLNLGAKRWRTNQGINQNLSPYGIISNYVSKKLELNKNYIFPSYSWLMNIISEVKINMN